MNWREKKGIATLYVEVLCKNHHLIRTASFPQVFDFCLNPLETA